MSASGTGTHDGAVSAPFAEFLRENREGLNQRFLLARRRWPGLDGGEFLGFLRATVEPLVASAGDAARAAALARAAYEIGLELAAQQLVGPGARYEWMDRLWNAVLPRLGRLIAPLADVALGAFSNAVHQLATTPGARPQAFLADLERVAELCADAGELLKAGQVCGWRAGLPQYRESALRVADSLPEPLALAAVAAPAGRRWSDLRERFAADPFFEPSEANGAAKVEVMARIGAFRGLGGAFVAPPQVADADGRLWVTSGAERFLLCADRYGATLHRTTPAEGRAGVTPPEVAVHGTRVQVRGTTLELGAAGPITSVALAARTLALTTARSHAVTLVRLGPA